MTSSERRIRNTYSHPNIMNIREIIEAAFGNLDDNTVNFKLVQTVLFLIARQMRILERRVEVDLGPLTLLSSDSTLSVTEVKIHTMQKKKKSIPKRSVAAKVGGGAGAKPGVGAGAMSAGGAAAGAMSGGAAGAGAMSGGAASAGAKSGVGAGAMSGSGPGAGAMSAGGPGGGAMSGGGAGAGAMSAGGPGAGAMSGGSSGAGAKSGSGAEAISGGAAGFGAKSGGGAEAIPGGATGAGAKSGGGAEAISGGGAGAGAKSGSGAGATSGGGADGGTMSSGGAGAGVKSRGGARTKSGGGADARAMPAGGAGAGAETISGGATSAGAAAEAMSGGATGAGAMSSGGAAAGAMSGGGTGAEAMSGGGVDAEAFSGGAAGAEAISGGAAGAEVNSGDAAGAQAISGGAVAGAMSGGGVDVGADAGAMSGSGAGAGQATGKKRADSFEEATKSPTPMASASSSSMEAQYEKLLVVKTVPSSEARNGEYLHGNKRMSQISVVTQEQFEQLTRAVHQLEEKLLPVGTPGFPENAELMEQLRKGASLTDAMAALQLSARLEATEKVLAQMTSMVTEIVKQTPGVTFDSKTQTIVVTDPTPKSGKGGKGKTGKPTKISQSPEKAEIQPVPAPAPAPLTKGNEEASDDQYTVKKDLVTHPELQEATTQMKAELLKVLQDLTKTTSSKADAAYKLSNTLDAKIDTGADITSRMGDLELVVKQFEDRINVLDADLSSQMTTYQEQLTQMQQDLEIGLDTMNEMLSNSGSDTVAMGELHARFTTLQIDFENIATEQKNLKDNHNLTRRDIASLWKQIEILRDVKSDREEVADALRDKAGIGELNGLVTMVQFDSVRGDFDKRIDTAFETFDKQEQTWQKAIMSIIKMFNDKADLVQVQCLKDDINKHLNRFKERMQIIQDVVGEPKAAIVSKKVFRDTACLCCGSPAHMDIEESSNVPALPKFHSTRQPAEGAEAESKTKGGGDYGICYPNLPIPHPRDPRSCLSLIG